MDSKEIRAELRAVKAEMRERGIKTVSCFNGGLDGGTYRANARLFQLKTQLADALKVEQMVAETAAVFARRLEEILK